MKKLRGIHLVIASGSELIQKYLQDALEQQGATISMIGFLNLDFVDQLEKHIQADVVLLDMNDSYNDDDEALELLLERIELPILFHDNNFNGCGELDLDLDYNFSDKAIKKLAVKLADLAAQSGEKTSLRNASDCNSEQQQVCLNDIEVVDKLEESTLSRDKMISAGENLSALEELWKRKAHNIEPSAYNIEPSAYTKKPAKNNNEPSVRKPSSAAEQQPDYAVNVWVLGASLGGPEAVKRFLLRIPQKLPVAFVLVQHLGAGFVSLLANQLDNSSYFEVKKAASGTILKHGEVVVVPADQQMTLASKGQIYVHNEAWKGHYKPSINDVIKEVTNSYQKRAGIILFSGMGADGILASQEFVDKYEGKIWAQSSETCVISSIPDAARKKNLVTYSGSPEALALKLSMLYTDNSSMIS